MSGRRIVDLTGKRFGQLAVLRIEELGGNGHGVRWRCACDCGNEAVVERANLQAGRQISCGHVREQIAPSHLKRGRGRPALGAQSRNQLVTVRLTAAELAAIESAVESSGDAEATPASWLRDRALEALGE